MTSGVSSTCRTCFARSGRHQCLHCNENYETLELLLQHQRSRQHFGGHYWKERRSSRVRRLPTRLRAISEELQVDISTEAFDLHLPYQDVSESEEESESNDSQHESGGAGSESAVLCLPDIEPTRSTAPVPEVEDDGQDSRSSLKVPIHKSSPVSLRRAPLWVQNIMRDGFQGFTFSHDYTRFWCLCGKTTSGGALSGNSRSNLMKHRSRKICTFDVAQTRVGEKSTVRKISQSKFRSLMVKAFVDCNISFSTAENESFQDLLTFGSGREHLKVPGRMTISRSVSKLYEAYVKSLKEDIREAASRIAITFDLWSDRLGRGYLGVTGHYFSKTIKLQSVVLAVRYLPKTTEGHSSSRIYDNVSSVLHKFLGSDWKEKHSCSVTDGARNVTSASQQLGSSRRCLQHSLQLVLKHFCISQSDVATAMACCNYLARLTKISQKVQQKIGRIPTGVCTRWNSYLDSAIAVYNSRTEIGNYVNDPSCTSDVAPVLRSRADFLALKGYRILHDLVAVLKPLMDITIDEEGEFYITSSAVVPRLISARRKISCLLVAAKDGSRRGNQIIDPELVASWEPLFYELWDNYLEGFLHDELFLCSTLLDARNGCGQELSSALLTEALSALESRMASKFECVSVAEASDEGNEEVMGPTVATARQNALGSFVLPSSIVAQAFGVALSESNEADSCAQAVRDELAALFKAVKLSGMTGDWKRNPLDLYRENAIALKLTYLVALDVFSVPAGESASERIFSIASRIHKFDRANLSPDQIERTTFIKKNSRAIGDL